MAQEALNEAVFVARRCEVMLGTHELQNLPREFVQFSFAVGTRWCLSLLASPAGPGGI